MEAFYKFLDHTADVMFVAKAGTLPELFEQCAMATEETMVDIARVKQKVSEKILVEEKSIEQLLSSFLDELVFFKDYKQLMFSKFEIEIAELGGGRGFELKCIAHGEKLDLTRHNPKVDVKAVTMHLFKVEQVSSGWKAQVILDI
ncbi:hypothetical protein A2642_02115 [Candidatus Nomurabacteria bacterium RIFCSPHIGHO2_01_FULL_39_10]|uniref:Archease domain-containing protein n=1 Tax=Candidatus Nomurabacteria bacterium RIFCSPHIGHO2_01_FULL_39_10 TaxID=1801733 RepID=A0A1F6V3H4_9BACT|nr:MAG: hypothetical protein A2642_02115 [Candidatus Nomurabacteria bacterium RIFCSPHIGHO2_01_FULL_39_10]